MAVGHNPTVHPLHHRDYGFGSPRPGTLLLSKKAGLRHDPVEPLPASLPHYMVFPVDRNTDTEVVYFSVGVASSLPATCLASGLTPALKIFHPLKQLLDFGLNVFNNENEKFQRWLKKPNISLGGATPESLFDSLTGIQEVRNSLNRLEYGNMA